MFTGFKTINITTGHRKQSQNLNNCSASIRVIQYLKKSELSVQGLQIQVVDEFCYLII